MAGQQDIWTGGNADFNTAADWTEDNTGAHTAPLFGQDVQIGGLGTGSPFTTTAETLNSVASDTLSTLTVGQTGVHNVTFTATNGTVLSGTDTSHLSSGWLGHLDVAVGSTLVVGNTFDNSGTLLIGLGATLSTSGSATLKLVGAVTLNGGGTVDLGELTWGGNIVNNTSGDGLTNVDNTIRGVGSIALANFNNEGKVIASGAEGDTLQVYATSNWTNSGTYSATSRNFLDLGKDGTSTTLTGGGSVDVDSGGTLEIAGTFTNAGNGIAFKGAGGSISSDGSTTTFTNNALVFAGEFGGTIGDSHMTFDNEGSNASVVADGQQLTISTGSNTITDDSGGIFEAEDGGDLIIDFPTNTGGLFILGHPGGGTIEALSGGTVTINAAVAPGGSGLLFQSGQVLISGGGTISVGTGGSISTPINISGTGVAILKVTNASDVISGQINGFANGDFFDLTAMPFGSGTSVNWVENGGGTAGTLTVTNGAKTEVFNVNGDFSNASFGAFNDGNGGTEIGLQAAAPSAGNTAVMVMNNPTNGEYEIYDVGGNAIESAYTLAGEISAGWHFLGLGTFQAGDSNDMLLRNGANFDAYYINNNAITSSALVGSVGTTWNFSGIGNFDGGSSLSELLLRNSTSGAFELYHVQGGGVLAGSSVAAVGNNLQVSGFGYFSETSTEQMAMEQANVSPGTNAYWLYTYNPATNSYGSAGASGTIGSNLSIVGVADMLGNGSSELIMEQANVTPGTNAYWAYMYNPSNNTFDAINNKALGTVGNNFHVVGFGPLGTAGQDEMLMQDAAGDFEVYKYNPSEGAFDGSSMGAVGSPWVLDGIADPPGSAAPASNAQLIQAMASMSGGGSASTGASPSGGGSEPTLPTLLTPTPHA